MKVRNCRVLLATVNLMEIVAKPNDTHDVRSKQTRPVCSVDRYILSHETPDLLDHTGGFLHDSRFVG